MSETKPTGLALLREPFPPHQISKLPKGTKEQNDCDYSKKRKCNICGGFHHPDIIHLDYVGHAALTDRLLDADPSWLWEPLALGSDGLPAFDKTGGLWGRLTVCGTSRIGYGNAQGKTYMDVGSREKEVIGDFLRNAAMRFGAALDLWHKGELHVDDEPEPKSAKSVPADELSKQDADTVAFLTEIAGNVRSMIVRKDVAGAYDEIEAHNLEIELKTALWALLDSKERSAIKAEATQRKQKVD